MSNFLKFLAAITLYFEAMAAICDSLPEARDNDPWVSVNFYEYNQKVESFKGTFHFFAIVRVVKQKIRIS